ncbi:MAG: DUF859 family phage minor structural protein [Acutalibacteraceae bacterium]
MAVNIYGNTTGSSSGKYDIWLNVTQNSQSVANNTSNITVKLYVKRNDGYSDSAYNLNESANSAKITVGGTVKVSQNLKIDTRNSASVLLASWTGNVSHNSDGTLTVAVGGSFSMSGTGLSGGTVSGSFKCTDIPRASSLSFSSTSVNINTEITATVNSASSGFSHSITWVLGSKSSKQTLSAGENSAKFTVPVSWASEVTASAVGNMSVTVNTYNGSKKIGSKSYNVKVKIPNNSTFSPDFKLVYEKVGTAVPEHIESLVQGKSKLKVSVSDVTLMYGAKALSYSVALGDLSSSKVPATFTLTSSGSITVKVTLKDSRGLTATKTADIYVEPYSPPSVKMISAKRCDEEGNLLNDGTYLLLDYTLGYSSINGSNTPELVGSFRRSNSESIFGEQEVLSSPAVIGGSLSPSNSYVLNLTVSDDITENSMTVSYDIPSANIPFNIRKGGNGASFGCFAENENELAVAWDLRLKGKMVTEDVELTLLESAENLHWASSVTYIPCLNMCYIRARMELSQDVEANKNYYVLHAGKNPVFQTPLATISSGGIFGACIQYETGDVFIRCAQAMSAGTRIFVSGFYIADGTQQSNI